MCGCAPKPRAEPWRLIAAALSSASLRVRVAQAPALVEDTLVNGVGDLDEGYSDGTRDVVEARELDGVTLLDDL